MIHDLMYAPDPWTIHIANLVAGKDEVYLDDIIKHLEIPIREANRATVIRIAACLDGIGSWDWEDVGMGDVVFVRQKKTVA